MRGFPRAHEDLAPAGPRDLDRDARRRAEAVDPETITGADAAEAQRAVADDPRAEQRRRFDVRECQRQRIRERLRHDDVIREAAVRVPPGEPRTLAEVLATTRAIRAGSARRAQPRRADPRSGLESRAAALDPPDDLVARHDRRRDEWKVALDD